MTAPELRSLPVELIDPNPEQPRTAFDDEALAALAASIRAEGLIQPVVVEASATGEAYVLTDGERRLRAARLAGLAEIPAVVHPAVAAEDDDRRLTRLTRALVANVQRADLNPVEEARALQRMADLGMSDAQIAQATGKSRPAVANKRRLLKLPPEVLDALAAGTLSERQAAALLPLYDLPDWWRAEAEAGDWNSWDRPSAVVTRVLSEDRPSSIIRDDVTRAIDAHSKALGSAGFTAHAFDAGPAVRAAVCGACRARLKRSSSYRCLDLKCFQAKAGLWKGLRVAEASRATGLPALPEYGRTAVRPYSQRHSFFTYDREGQAAAARILQAGCRHLHLDSGTGKGDTCATLPAFPDVRFLCYGPAGCTCWAQAKAEASAHRTPTPAEVRREQEQQAIARDLVQPATEVLAAALVAQDLRAWRTTARRVTNAGDMATLEEVFAAIAGSVLRPYSTDPDLVRAHLSRLLEDAGVPLPWPEPAQEEEAAIPTARLLDAAGALALDVERLAAWLEAQAAIPEAIARHNLANADRLAATAWRLLVARTDAGAIMPTAVQLLNCVDELRAWLPEAEPIPAEIRQLWALLEWDDADAATA
ncbi:MAG: ParB/RepB/Spo0J family partition protein [Ardenticatenaceae bacterium]|nr:ParB/RepB/Spo0J family partition protein [Ardenticatenaceae bacterium]